MDSKGRVHRPTLNDQATYKLGARVVILGNDERGEPPIAGKVRSLHRRGNEPVYYKVEDDATGKTWFCWDVDLTEADRC